MDSQRLLRFLKLLEAIPIEYMVSGSIAAILYGKPRFTHDINVIVVFPIEKIGLFCQNFATDEFYCPPQEVIEEEIKRGDTGHFNIIDQMSGFKMDLYPFAHDSLVQWGLGPQAFTGTGVEKSGYSLKYHISDRQQSIDIPISSPLFHGTSWEASCREPKWRPTTITFIRELKF